MLELYQSEECPACQEVREALNERGLSYVIHNPRKGRGADKRELNGLTYEALEALGGVDRIPFLVDTERGAALYGPEAILEHLGEHYGTPERVGVS